jgi:hypothetical protein
MNDNLIETISYRGHEIKVFYDLDPDMPNDWVNNDQFIVYDHRDFTVKRDGFDPSDIFEHIQANPKAKLFKGYRIFPLYAYIHGDVALSLGRMTYPFTCGWDTSFKGFVLVKREKDTWSQEDAYKVADSLVDTWNMYLRGEVYGYVSSVSSCWGFYGDDGRKYMIREAKEEIDINVAYRERIHKQQHFSRLKEWIRHGVPLYARMSY